MEQLLAIFLCFILLYNPPIISLNSLVISGLISYVYLLFNFKRINKKLTVKLIITMFIFLIILVYLISVILLRGGVISNATFLIYVILFVFPTSITISTILIKNKIDLIHTMELLIITGTIQGIISILTLLFPTLQNWIVNRMVGLGYSSVWLKITEHRMFGYSDGLTYSMPLVQSFLAIASIYLYLKYDKKYILYAPLLIISAIVNARISFVILAIGFILLLFEFRTKLLNNIFSSILNVFLIILFFRIGTNLLGKLFPDIFQWISTGLNDILGFLSGDINEGYFTYITDQNVYILPGSPMGKIFGEGIRIMGGTTYNSDVGFINDVWLGGLIYITSIYLLTLFMLLSLKKSINSNFTSFLTKLLFVILIVSNFKGFIVSSNGMYLTLILLFTYNQLSKKYNTNNLLKH